MVLFHFTTPQEEKLMIMAEASQATQNPQY
jgi:hypothetical protein